jgi:transposase
LKQIKNLCILLFLINKEVDFMSKDKIEINQEELTALINRIEHAIEYELALSTEDLKLLLSAIVTLSELQQRIEDQDITLYKLRKLLGIIKKSESRRTNQNSSNKRNKTKKIRTNNKEKKPIPAIIHKLTEYTAGQTCPACNHGKLYKYSPGNLLRITGQMPYSAENHVTEQLRCNGCHKIYKANLPTHILEDGNANQQYGYSARTLMVINKFFTGTPYNHQSNLSEIFGLSISASTIFDQSEYVANDVMPIYYELMRGAANARNFLIDDTHNRILEQEPEVRAKRNGKGTQTRTGVYTSGLIALLPNNREIVLFETSLGHAGEHLDKILSKRDPGLEKPIIMSDGLNSNTPTVIEVEQTNCNAHSRRQFYDLESKYPKEIKWLLEQYSTIWKNEEKIRENNLNLEQRLKYHQENSLPVMERIKEWAINKQKEEDFEENSSLGKAVKYLLKRYKNLIKFCKVLGALIDNNRMEETLKIIIRGRKTAYFYKTINGAGVANVLISIIATAYRADINVFDYLLFLQKNKEEVKKKPHLWLPWNYAEQITKLNEERSSEPIAA